MKAQQRNSQKIDNVWVEELHHKIDGGIKTKRNGFTKKKNREDLIQRQLWINVFCVRCNHSKCQMIDL